MGDKIFKNSHLVILLKLTPIQTKLDLYHFPKNNLSKDILWDLIEMKDLSKKN